MTPAQITFWEGVLAKVVTTDDWKKDLEAQYWEGNFLTSREFGKFLETEYNETKAIMTELGLAK